jgi:hypothetical protein
MSDSNGRFRVHWDPTIKLGEVLLAASFLVGGGAAYATLDFRISQAARDIDKVEREFKAADTRIELDLGRRIVETRQHVDSTAVRTAEDIKDIKTIIRDGFRDLDMKMERKADKPGR